MGHKKPPFERLLAKIVLAVPVYGHFCVEHNRGHHVHVSTPTDPASARMGESIYKFALREKLGNGRYERCQPHHSWNANYICSNIVLFHLERHSGHHANPTRRYQSLRNFDDLPELPNGYYGMFPLSYVLLLWYWVMDKRVLELPHIAGDLSKVNIDPGKRSAIIARYGSGGQLSQTAC